MESKGKKLPLLQCKKSKTTFVKDRIKIEQLFQENARNRATHKDYRNDDDFTTLKAANFLSRVETLDSPQVIFSISDQVKRLVGQHNKENEGEWLREGEVRGDVRRVSEERVQALQLGKWMDDKLKLFRAKRSVTLMDVLEYKQTVLNYALGRIIDTLTKKCREEGQLLSLIWNNTFAMFEGVFGVLAQAGRQREREKAAQAEEMQGLFEVNHNFLREENAVLAKQNSQIFEKMRNVIRWNRRLRRERKQLFTKNRVLQYRNVTYAQSLEQTVEMLLQRVPDAAVIQTAKMIMQRLGREKNRRRHFKQQADQEFEGEVKALVYRWLRNNTAFNDDVLANPTQTQLRKEDCFIFEEIKDHNEMNKVDIYDFFKLYDIGIQATVNMNTTACQSTIKSYKNMEVMTRGPNIRQNGCQTTAKFETDQKIQAVSQRRIGNTKQSVRPKDNPTRQVKHKKTKAKEITLASNKSLSNFKPARAHEAEEEERRRYYQRGSNIEHDRHKLDKNNVRLEGKEFNSVASLRKDTLGDERRGEERREEGEGSSMTDLLQDEIRTKGQTTTKHLITNNSFNARVKSIGDIPEHTSGSTRYFGQQRRRERKQSLAYVRGGEGSVPRRNDLNLRKKFAQAYNQNRAFMQNNKEEFEDQLMRRRSFYRKKKVEFADFRRAEQATKEERQFVRGRPVTNYWKQFYENANYVSGNIERLTRKYNAPSNIAKTKMLLSAQNVFVSITASIEQLLRVPPKNKVFVNNSLAMITRYIEGLFPDYLRQIRREKEELIGDCEKALYPLNILLMECMMFKYGLKEIAQKKIRNFIEKVLTFSSVSEKVELYSILLGLAETDVGSDQLLVYLKCLVYFDYKKTVRQTTQSTKVDIEVVRENLRGVLVYFFDEEHINVVQLKIEFYFQQNASTCTVEGIALVVVRELLKRKRELKQRYIKVHQICAQGDNFYSNAFKMLKIFANYRTAAELEAQLPQEGLQELRRAKGYHRDSTQSIEALQRIRKRGEKRKKTGRSKVVYDIGRISSIIRELLERSDIMDEEYGKSITVERFITAAVICGVPAYTELESVLKYFRGRFEALKEINTAYAGVEEDTKGMEKLSRMWTKDGGRGEEGSEEGGNCMWKLAKLYSDKLENEIIGVMGKVGTIGLYIETGLFNLGTRIC